MTKKFGKVLGAALSNVLFGVMIFAPLMALAMFTLGYTWGLSKATQSICEPLSNVNAMLTDIHGYLGQ